MASRILHVPHRSLPNRIVILQYIPPIPRLSILVRCCHGAYSYLTRLNFVSSLFKSLLDSNEGWFFYVRSIGWGVGNGFVDFS